MRFVHVSLHVVVMIATCLFFAACGSSSSNGNGNGSPIFGGQSAGGDTNVFGKTGGGVGTGCYFGTPPEEYACFQLGATDDVSKAKMDKACAGQQNALRFEGTCSKDATRGVCVVAASDLSVSFYGNLAHDKILDACNQIGGQLQ